jgi:O-antigen/teichoic acid export membrane protein
MSAAEAPPIRTSLLWSSISTIGMQVVSLVVFVVLARLLGTKLFGLVALAAIIVDLMQVVAGAGLTEAVVQKPELKERDADTAFWMAMISGAAFCGLINLAAGPLAAFFHQPELRQIIPVLSVLFLITPMGTVHSARLMRDLKFKALAGRNTIANLTGGIAGVSAAFAGWGVWALVTQRIVTAVGVVVFVWLATRWRPRLRFDRESLQAMFPFGSRIMLSQILIQLNARAPELVTGSFFGPAAVGLVRAGSRMIEVLTQITFTPFQQVALPIQARAQENAESARAAYLSLSRISSLVMFPAFLGLFAVADPLIRLIFGDPWAQSADAVKLLSLHVFNMQMSVLMMAGVAAAGRARIVLGWSALQVTVGVAAAAAAAPFGWHAMLSANLGRAYLLAPIGLVLLRRATGIPIMAVLKTNAAPAAAAVIMAVTVTLADLALLQGEPVLLRLILLVNAGVAVYVAAVLALDRSLLPEVLKVVRGLRGRLAPEAEPTTRPG